MVVSRGVQRAVCFPNSSDFYPPSVELAILMGVFLFIPNL